MTIKSAPTPWEYVPGTEHHGPYIVSTFGSTIADFYMMSQPSERSTASGGPSKPIYHLSEMADPNAALAVHCVNNHEKLVELAELFKSSVQWLIKVDIKNGDAEGAGLKSVTLGIIEQTLARAKL